MEKLTLYHCTTKRKLDRYKATGCILSPVRGWRYMDSARTWGKRTGRDIILKIEVGVAWPLPDHYPRYHAYWADENIKEWEEV